MAIQIAAVIHSKVRGLGRAMPKIKRAVFQDLGEYYFRQLFPDHFKTQARSEFQYETRSQKYLKSKRFRGTGQGRFIDNIFSGRSRRFMMEGPSIKATSTGVTVKLDAPLYFRRRISGQPDKVSEITKVSDRHRRLLAQRAQNTTFSLMQHALKNIPAQKVKG